MMDMIPPTDYWCLMNSPEAESFVESLLVSDELIFQPYADQPQLTQENDSSGNSLSMGKELGYDMWSSELEKSNFMDSLGLGSIGGVTSPSEDCCSTLPLKGSILMQDQGEFCDALYQLDKEGDFGDSPSIEFCTDFSLQGNESSIYCSYQEEGDDIYVSIESVEVEDSWSTVEDQMLRAAMADNILKQHVIQWNRIAEVLPWKTPLEVFNRTNQLLQTVLGDLANFTTEQQQQDVGVIMSPPEQQKHHQQHIRLRGVWKMWSEEEHEKFLVGIERYGWGNWKKVATLIPSRTVPQITSHAQNYLKQNKPNNMAKRRTRNNLLMS